MEINNKIAKCSQCGNFYDADRYSHCPNYQNSGASGLSETMPVGGGMDIGSMGGFQATEPIGYGPAIGQDSIFPPTMIGGRCTYSRRPADFQTKSCFDCL